ncbi:hypothetical protein MGWOODY_XGa1542 [hydrothermal vent metagenome]|uniref:Uncharacterized protein n=1 Tax=hydrothermal vent metagenome TaxID=652676 RepID=A0A160TV20_9ZZZZ
MGTEIIRSGPATAIAIKPCQGCARAIRKRFPENIQRHGVFCDWHQMGARQLDR